MQRDCFKYMCEWNFAGTDPSAEGVEKGSIAWIVKNWHRFDILLTFHFRLFDILPPVATIVHFWGALLKCVRILSFRRTGQLAAKLEYTFLLFTSVQSFKPKSEEPIIDDISRFRPTEKIPLCQFGGGGTDGGCCGELVAADEISATS